MRTALYWHLREDGTVQCDLCPHRCVVREGGQGLCGARGLRGGELRALGYGAISSAHIDPIEKKPLYHYYPGGRIFSIGGWGCNLGCLFCQNWGISQEVHLESGARSSPDDVARAAGERGSVGVAYTYNEPLVGFEFVLACARAVRAAGHKNVLVTNGFINTGPAAELLPWIDALNIDIKSMDESFYRSQCKGSLAPVLHFVEQAAKMKCHVEITNLLIPGLNDAEGQLDRLARWVAEHLGRRTPLHLSAYRPEYRCSLPATPVEVLHRAHAACAQHLLHVYLGNVVTATGQNTRCPDCGSTWIRRSGYSVDVCGIRNGTCASCERETGVIL
jgi:pyruvate formate lyase activating enzyme